MSTCSVREDFVLGLWLPPSIFPAQTNDDPPPAIHSLLATSRAPTVSLSNLQKKLWVWSLLVGIVSVVGRWKETAG